MSQNDTIDPTAAGFHWESEAVSKRFGPNDSDKRVINDAAQILVIEDVDKFRAEFGDAYLLEMSNGTSTRVLCQSIGRKHDGKNVEKNRGAVLNAIRGVRTRSQSQVRRPMPDGTFYHGSNEVEYRQLYMAQLVDLGTPATLAQTIASRMAF